MTTTWSERAFAYFIMAVILGAFFLLALIQGIIVHWAGHLDMALILYLVALILAGMTKMCKHEIHMDMCKRPAPRKRPKRRK